MLNIPSTQKFQSSKPKFQIKSKVNDLSKSKEFLFFVIPTEVGIQAIQAIQMLLDSCFRRSDNFSDFLRIQQSSNTKYFGI
jgi:hypothetical protein